MAKHIDFDTSDFDSKVKTLMPSTEKQSKTALFQMGQEIGRLGTFEVPHDTGMLQNSYGIDPDGEGYTVGYNKVYAAKLHEHPEYHFQKGRKAKYLEDPIKNNLRVLLEFYKNTMAQIF